MKTKADHILDIADALPDFALLKISRTFRDMNPGEMMEILGCDADIREDLLRILPDHVFRLIREEAGPPCRLWILKQRKY